ncbi:leucyl aminopeptidase [Cellvibrio japonicus]|uniref:Probable cytosol aminopeptidase n=1 Tax=Cellvibrio japonicus (strain Ueda107) TaxID=498211 RepID=B3PDJ0_CELJU|nr:leucyl aminopeptidase [Cellvibrio japonicus]ACE84545.1 cytosol aminopeptidase [Cellvibrio japonicus Ueda107]
MSTSPAVRKSTRNATTAKTNTRKVTRTAPASPIVYSAKPVDPVKYTTQCLVVGVSDGLVLSPSAKAINDADAGQLETLLKREGFQGKAGQSLLLIAPQGIAAERLLVLGLGSHSEAGTSPGDYRKAVQKISEALKPTPCQDIAVLLGDTPVSGQAIDWQARQLAEALSPLDHRSDHLKSKPAEFSLALRKVTFAANKTLASKAQSGLDLGAAIAKGVNLARYLGDLPGNICTPSYLAERAKQLAGKQARLSVNILDEKEMKALGMGSLLSVSAGSDQPAKLIVLEYKGGSRKDAPIALVGKGITFDTGGISLKPGAGMDEMKFDMCGAASVLGTFQTLVDLQLPINVVGVIAASENMPGGKATKPGDIVTSMSGQTIEILNTDAEGRLVLCDALTYTERFKPKAVVDIATLTGACVIALGNHATGLFSNSDELAKTLVSAGEQAHDRAWQMPLWEDYQKQLDSNFADIANVGGREAGSITAACFLARFTRKMAWAHLDIAGTAWRSGAAKGATGRPVGLLVQYLLNSLR